MKAYKGFNKDMTCTPDGCAPFQYKEGETYHEDEAVLCEKGFHACEMPTDVFNYYAPGTSVYHEVDLEDVNAERKEDTKVCGKTIKIGAKLDVEGLVKAQFDYVKSRTTTEDNDPKKANAGNYGAANAGNCGAANAGYCGAANAGDFGAANAGYYGAANAGNYGAANAGNYGAANAGNCGAANAGDKGAANAGDKGAANAGNYGAANAGNYGAANAGDYGAANAGYCGAANAGDFGAANAGYYGAANAGDCGAANAGYYGAANAGDFGAANAGNYGAANAGNYGAANAGNFGAAISRGEAAIGKYGVAVARGNEECKNRVKGNIGSILIIALENDENFEIKDFAVGIVDGEKIKADTWYKAENGQMVEVEEE